MESYGSRRCGCSGARPCGCSRKPKSTCARVCTTLVVDTSWNIPAVGAQAELSIPGVNNILIGSSVYNPAYGSFKIVSFSATTQKLVVTNLGYGNKAPGTIVPTDTYFNVVSPLFTTKGAIDWVPNVRGFTPLTFTLLTAPVKKYWAQEERVEIALSVTGTLGGAAGPVILLSLPIVANGDKDLLSVLITDNGVVTPGYAQVVDAATYGESGDPILAVKKYNNANFTNSGPVTITVDGKYTAAPYNI